MCFPTLATRAKFIIGVKFEILLFQILILFVKKLQKIIGLVAEEIGFLSNLEGLFSMIPLILILDPSYVPEWGPWKAQARKG